MKILLGVLLALGCCLGVSKGQAANPCNSFPANYASGTITAGGNTQLIAAPTTGQAIRICAYTITVSQPASAVTWGLVSGSGTACATNTVNVTPALPGIASSLMSAHDAFPGFVLSLPVNNALCLSLGGTVTAATVQVLYVLL